MHPQLNLLLFLEGFIEKTTVVFIVQFLEMKFLISRYSTFFGGFKDKNTVHSFIIQFIGMIFLLWFPCIKKLEVVELNIGFVFPELL